MQTNGSPQPVNNRPPLKESGYATAAVTKAPEWHGTIAWDALLNGMATGLFMVAAVSELAAPDVFIPMATVA